MRIVAVDPGLKTGVAVFFFDETYEYNEDFFKLLTVPFEEYTSLPYWFMPERTYSDEYDDTETVLIVEDFILRPDLAQKQGGNRMWSSEIIGYLRGKAKEGGVKFILQPASAQVSDGLLKSLGLWDEPKRLRHQTQTGDLPHLRSAMKHIVHYMSKEHPLWIQQRLEHTSSKKQASPKGKRTTTSVKDTSNE
jgi:hypothetical protein